MLYPIENELREVRCLDGIWQFKADYDNRGRDDKWYVDKLSDPINMAVPSSYNDITQELSLRNHIGDVWYQKDFVLPNSWNGRRIFIRFGSVTHHCSVWVNGEQAASHKGGYLPFEADISDIVKYGENNVLTVVVNNVLDWTTLPPGEVVDAPTANSRLNPHTPEYPDSYKIQDYFHDFFNYAGIHRSVKLCAVNSEYVESIKTETSYDQAGHGFVNYSVKTSTGRGGLNLKLYDEQGQLVASGHSHTGKLVVENVNLWQPGNAYLYKLCVELFEQDGSIVDKYSMNVGVRTVEVRGKEFLINGEPFYFKGFGKHEDSDFRGKGYDAVLNVLDMNLLKWIGANSFRTSHYPYCEEILDLCDREGIVVIDESPAVGLMFNANARGSGDKVFCEEKIGKDALSHHRDVMKEMIDRDINHPCVVMWSVANEAAVYEDGAVDYFREIADYTRKLDRSRPITNVINMPAQRCKVSQFFDVVSVNSYYGWYWNLGDISSIDSRLSKDMENYYNKFNKPVLITEYGAETIAGLHNAPALMFTEEYQCQMLDAYHKVFDRYDFVIGEHVWNFADFMTKQGTSRVLGNRKGVFTRQRQPKAAAHLLKERWTQN
ncbi:MAG: beta-glucuronidase [Sedimentisphaeraceae bacterium JB056]